MKLSCILLLGILMSVSTSSGNEKCSEGSCVHGFCGISECICFSGWTGERCDEDEDECSYNICSPGSCTNTIGSFECKCPSGWFGRICEMRISNCTSDDECLNGGKCTDRACECLPDFYGSNCEDPDGWCARNPCVNGFCHSEKKRSRCLCFLGWKGERCDEDVDECAQNKCSPGTCKNTIGSYECICPKGRSGRLCTKEGDNSAVGEDPFASVIVTSTEAFGGSVSNLTEAEKDQLLFVNSSEIIIAKVDDPSNVTKMAKQAEMNSCGMQNTLLVLVVILVVVIIIMGADRVCNGKRNTKKDRNTAVFPTTIGIPSPIRLP